MRSFTCRNAIVSWIKKKIGSSVYNITTTEDAERVLTSEDKVVLAYLDSLVVCCGLLQCLSFFSSSESNCVFISLNITSISSFCCVLLSIVYLQLDIVVNCPLMIWFLISLLMSKHFTGFRDWSTFSCFKTWNWC